LGRFKLKEARAKRRSVDSFPQKGNQGMWQQRGRERATFTETNPGITLCDSRKGSDKGEGYRVGRVNLSPRSSEIQGGEKTSKNLLFDRLLKTTEKKEV